MRAHRIFPLSQHSLLTITSHDRVDAEPNVKIPYIDDVEEAVYHAIDVQELTLLGIC